MQIEVDRSTRRLELRSIRGPVNGAIVEIFLVPGESLDIGEREMMFIAEVDPLNVEVNLPAAQFRSVQFGTLA